MHYFTLILLALALGGCTGAAKTKDADPVESPSLRTIRVSPDQTGADIQTIKGSHLALYDTRAPSRHKLVLMIGGTDAIPDDNRRLDGEFATMGFRVIGLDYKNTVITTVCSNSTDRACFNQFRQEIMFGTPVSAQVEVDSANSLMNRFRQLLTYLVKHDSAGQWNEFSRNGQIQWDKIIVAGHSQGAGHAAYLGKYYPVSRVVLFAGPQDYLVNYQAPADWLSEKGVTPPDRYYAFLHLKDPFNVTRQLANCAKLMATTAPDSAAILPGRAVRGEPHILITNIVTENPHWSLINLNEMPLTSDSSGFKPVWAYLLLTEPKPKRR